MDDWNHFNRAVPRLVDALPNGPIGHPTIRVFLAGGVPEVMLHLRNMNLLQLDALTVTGETLGKVLDWWQASDRRKRLRDHLATKDGIDPDTVIMSPDAAKKRGLTSTITFPRGNLCPEGSVIKSTAIDPSQWWTPTVYTERPARRRCSSPRRRRLQGASRGRARRRSFPGDVLVLCCRGPLGSGMEETYQVTSALKHLKWGKQVAVLTDARFSGVSTGACVGHITPRRWPAGPSAGSATATASRSSSTAPSWKARST